MWSYKKRKLLTLSLLTLVSACQTAPPDIPICVEIHATKGYCVSTISAKEFVVDETHPYDKKTWWEARPTMLLIPATSWAKLKIYIIQQCKQTGACDKEITSWERTIQTVDKTMGAK